MDKILAVILTFLIIFAVIFTGFYAVLAFVAWDISWGLEKPTLARIVAVLASLVSIGAVSGALNKR